MYPWEEWSRKNDDPKEYHGAYIAPFRKHHLSWYRDNGEAALRDRPTGDRLCPRRQDHLSRPNVKENLEMGIKRKNKGHWTFERVYEMFPILKKREGQMGGTLSGGEQQMLTIARTLMGNPRLLLLDEPSEGLAPLIVKELENHVRRLKTEGMPIISQNRIPVSPSGSPIGPIFWRRDMSVGMGK